MVIVENTYNPFFCILRILGLSIDNGIYSAAPDVDFDMLQYTTTEGEGVTVVFRLELDKEPDRQVTVLVTTSDGSAGGYCFVVNIVCMNINKKITT